LPNDVAESSILGSINQLGVITGARQILELIARGQTVGITGPSHAVINNLI
jgi:hypothetical protein